MHTYIIAEIGINHNGCVDTAKRLISLAHTAGCDAVKFQKRTIDIVYTQAELAKERHTPYGKTNRELKEHLEFQKKEYDAIDSYCKLIGIDWLASCWDEDSVDFISRYDVPMFKIASASITDEKLVRYTSEKGKPIIMSTGMSTLEEIDEAVKWLHGREITLLHTCSAYPSAYEDLNLSCIKTLKARYGVRVGYSGHETGVCTSVAAVALGAEVIERHITLDRAMWGTDQAASLGPSGIIQLVRDIRLVEKALGNGEKKLIDAEIPVKEKLRRIGKS